MLLTSHCITYLTKYVTYLIEYVTNLMEYVSNLPEYVTNIWEFVHQKPFCIKINWEESHPPPKHELFVCVMEQHF